MKDLVAEDVGHEQEGLEEPGRMGEVPLHRAGVGHRLDLAILGAQGFGEPVGHRADGPITIDRRQSRRARVRERGRDSGRSHALARTHDW